MIRSFFAGRTVRGFYFPVIAALLSLAAAIIYIVGYTGSSYYNLAAFLLPLIASIAYFARISLPWTSRYAATVLEILVFIGFLIFVRHVYLYLSEVFYAGVTPTAIAALKPQFVLTLVFELLAVILANFGIYVAPKKAIAAKKEESVHA